MGLNMEVNLTKLWSTSRDTWSRSHLVPPNELIDQMFQCSVSYAFRGRSDYRPAYVKLSAVINWCGANAWENKQPKPSRGYHLGQLNNNIAFVQVPVLSLPSLCGLNGWQCPHDAQRLVGNLLLEAISSCTCHKEWFPGWEDAESSCSTTSGTTSTHRMRQQ